MKLTIIIPAFNAQDYIESCLESCFNQDLQPFEYEIIIINDGSTDKTLEKVIAYTKTHANLHISTQENKGNGAARNAGSALAKGKYIYFLDADDFIATNTLGTLINLQEQHHLDMLVFSSCNTNNASQVRSGHSGTQIKVDAVVNGFDYLSTYNYAPEVWRYIIKKSFYFESKLSFYDRKFIQDSYFTPTLISKAKRIASIDYDVHRYRKSPNSISRNKASEHLRTHMNDMCFCIHELEHLKNDLKKNDYSDNRVFRKLHMTQQRYVFILIIRFMRSKFHSSELKTILSDFKKIEVYPLHQYIEDISHKSHLKAFLASVLNKEYLLYPSMKIYRLFRNLSR